MQYIYVLAGIALTALCWGSYGPVLHEGQHHLSNDRIKPLICVGFGYLIVAIIFPMIILAMQGKLSSGWTMSGITWSFAAGCAGTFGALGIIIALTNGGKPWFVMPLVFGCAPVVTTIVSMTTKGLWDQTSPLFYAGIILVVAGAVTVLLFAPSGKKTSVADAKTEHVSHADTKPDQPKATETAGKKE